MDCSCLGDGVGSGGQEGLGGVISVGARRGTEEDSWGKGRGRREKLWLWSRCFLSLDYLNASRDSLHPGWVLAGAARLALRRAPEGRRSLIMDGARAIRGGYHSIPPDTVLSSRAARHRPRPAAPAAAQPAAAAWVGKYEHEYQRGEELCETCGYCDSSTLTPCDRPHRAEKGPTGFGGGGRAQPEDAQPRAASSTEKNHRGGANFYKEQLVAPESVMYSWNVALFLSALRLARYRPSR